MPSLFSTRSRRSRRQAPFPFSWYWRGEPLSKGEARGDIIMPQDIDIALGMGIGGSPPQRTPLSSSSVAAVDALWRWPSPLLLQPPPATPIRRQRGPPGLSPYLSNGAGRGFFSGENLPQLIRGGGRESRYGGPGAGPVHGHDLYITPGNQYPPPGDDNNLPPAACPFPGPPCPGPYLGDTHCSPAPGTPCCGAGAGAAARDPSPRPLQPPPTPQSRPCPTCCKGIYHCCCSHRSEQTPGTRCRPFLDTHEDESSSNITLESDFDFDLDTSMSTSSTYMNMYDFPSSSSSESNNTYTNTETETVSFDDDDDDDGPPRFRHHYHNCHSYHRPTSEHRHRHSQYRDHEPSNMSSSSPPPSPSLSVFSFPSTNPVSADSHHHYDYYTAEEDIDTQSTITHDSNSTLVCNRGSRSL